MGGGMSRVMPGIYVGGLTAAKSPIQLSTHQITHLCTVIHEGVHFDSGRKQIFFRADDSPDENLSRFFEDAVNFIHEARVSGGSVLIHCACGVSRSVTITLAYLLVATDFSLGELIKAIQGARHCACPNYGFRKQLIEFEQTKRHLELRERLFARFGPWPEDKRQADAAELKEHIATQEYYLENGVYPGEESLEKASSGDSSQPGKLNVGFFTVHTKNGARDLAEFIASRSNPPDSSEAIETENSNTT
ncbi:Dual specificity protein phosphatase [Fasciolopsis buskii]|uniref:Dual specificity protein phosphatase n=1 Tax=Fasciolopsis buskii TaxID=27845 RepID=A0A8E0S3B3_9TREM|nr:Dual specificity protein phosphatase [Fasciolopsis buski]